VRPEGLEKMSEIFFCALGVSVVKNLKGINGEHEEAE
jgi:hypothetical protein